MAIDRDVVRGSAARDRRRAASSRGSRRSGGRRRRRGRRERRAGRRATRVGPRASRASCVCSPSSGGRAVGADLEITLDRARSAPGCRRARRSRSRWRSALCDAAGFELAPTATSRSPRSGPSIVATGVPCGNQDQLASVFGRAGHALLLDCRTLEIEPLPLPDRAARARRALRACRARSKAARTRSGARRASRSGRRLGLRALRDATLRTGPRPAARGRHAVTEMARVAGLRRRVARRRHRRARSADAREPRVVARRHGGVDARARRARRVPRRRGRARRAAHRRRLRRLRGRAGARRPRRAIAATARPRPTGSAPGSSRRPGSSTRRRRAPDRA